MEEQQSESALYRLGRNSPYWMALERPAGANASWQCQVTARSRGGARTTAALLETTPVRPLATVTVRGESYPLPIGWHEMRRGGVFCLGGERRTGLDGSALEWEMRWQPMPGLPSAFQVEMRIRATPRREGHLEILLNTPLHRPDVWLMPPAAARGHGATLAWSAYHQHAVSVVTLDGEPGGWDEERGGFALAWRGFSLGGGRLLRFGLCFSTAACPIKARRTLVRQYAALAGPSLHPVASVPGLDDAAALAALTRPDAFMVKGAERIYLRAENAEPGTFYAGFPHYPADALKAISDCARFQPSDALSRLARFGAHALAADFQVMGRQGESEPNKGAFWDRITPRGPSDHAGGTTHGLTANARLARAFFLLHGATGEPLLRQSALNICQWLILKQNSDGYYDGARVQATRGLSDDGKFLPQPCALDGAEAIRPLAFAFRATANEVFVKAAWKIANFLLENRLPEFDAGRPTEIAAVLLGLIALNAEAPTPRLDAAIADWGAWLRAVPLSAASPCLNADGLHSGLFECAQAGFYLHAQTSDTAYLRYAFSALELVPAESRLRSWHALESRATALMSLACLLSDARPDFDALHVHLGWRVFSPDPATSEFLQVTGSAGEAIDFLPLVCRLNDQLLLLAIAPPAVTNLSILKNGRRPLVHDLLTKTEDFHAPLHFMPGEKWARVGLFTVDP